MTTDSATISISVTPGATKSKDGKDKASKDDAEAFSISLEVARDEADGEEQATSITIQGVTSGEDDDAGQGGTDPADNDVTIEIATGSGEDESTVTIEFDTMVFSGEDLAQNLSASTVLGGGNVATNRNGSFGVTGSLSGSRETRLEVGETLTFTLPPAEGAVIGGQVTITNLFCDGDKEEGALVFAYDDQDRQLASYFALGNESGTVTIDIEVPFARLDFKAVDNGAALLRSNSNYGVSDVSAVFASVIEDAAEGAGGLIDDILTGAGDYLAGLVDFRHFGKVSFQVSRVSANRASTLDALSGVNARQGDERDPSLERHIERELVDHQAQVVHDEIWPAERRAAS